ncbi:MAG: DinB family protein [Pirellulaceae bacterium]
MDASATAQVDAIRLDIVRHQLESAREYVMGLLADLDEHEWFLMPEGCATHVAWQVGHLAMAEYGLCLFRQRGRQPEDLELMPGTFRKAFSRGSTPSTDTSKYPSRDSILETLAAIRSRVLAELPGFAGSGLDDPIDPPHFAYPTRIGALLFSSHHELLHAGQIGLLRRQLGKDPIR